MQRTRSALTTAIVSLAIALGFVPACDDKPHADATFRGLPPPPSGWTDGDKGCKGYYAKTEAGTMCLPPCGDEACAKGPQVNGCGQAVGGDPVCLTNEHCAYQCADNQDCIEGQRCGDGYCVWENMPQVEQVCTLADDICTCEDAGGDDVCGIAEGSKFGPCTGEFPYGSCGAGSTCMAFDDGAAQGWYCAPDCDDNDPQGVQECASNICEAPAICEPSGVYGIACDEWSDCTGGSFCYAGHCMWPANSACIIGEAYGPCGEGGMCGQGLTCVPRFEGTDQGWYCAPGCDSCNAPENIACRDELADGAASFCENDHCALACAVDGDCADGALCIFGACAWKN